MGFTYIALLAGIVILGILMGAAGKYWQAVMQRDREEELLFRGDQYRLAIERYYSARPGKFEYPRSIDDLLSDDRFPQARRHLRQKYTDPMTGEDFELITAQTMTMGVPLPVLPAGIRAGIVGVYSKSEKEPIRQTGFPEPYLDFEGKKQYSEWKFVFLPQQPQGQAQATRPQ